MPKTIQLVFWKSQAPTHEPYTTSEIIAEAAGMNRRTVNRLIQTHKADLEEFGILRFEIAEIKGRGQPERRYRLNEQQATL
jgi:phage regulator Rha-like protein|nr:MAG TPA: regulatory protein [Caudoviricetes sp.]